MMLRDQVRHELDMLQHRARIVDIDALRDGSWLVPVVRDALGEGAAALDREALVARHERQGTEALADACIARAQRRAMLAGGLSASAYASVVAGALATGGVATGLAIPAAVAAFTVDLWFTARTQLRLAWELAVVYDHPVSLDQDGHLVALCRLAFGVDAAAAAAAVVGAVVPEVSRFTTRALTSTTRLASHTILRGLGRTVAQRGLVRYAVPAIGVPLCAAVNHVSTGRTGRAAQTLLRGHAQARRLADLLEEELQATPALVLACMLWVVGADERARGVEVALVRGSPTCCPTEIARCSTARWPVAAPSCRARWRPLRPGRLPPTSSRRRCGRLRSMGACTAKSGGGWCCWPRPAGSPTSQRGSPPPSSRPEKVTSVSVVLATGSVGVAVIEL